MLDGEFLCVDGRGIVKRVKYYRGFLLEDKAYKPNGNTVFVNPQTNFLEEGELPSNGSEETANRIKNRTYWKKTSDFKSNGNRVLFHPELKELAEVAPAFRGNGYDKVRNLGIEALV